MVVASVVVFALIVPSVLYFESAFRCIRVIDPRDILIFGTPWGRRIAFRFTARPLCITN